MTDSVPDQIGEWPALADAVSTEEQCYTPSATAEQSLELADNDMQAEESLDLGSDFEIPWDRMPSDIRPFGRGIQNAVK